MTTEVEAAYFDGRSSRRHAVRLSIVGDALHIAGESIERTVPLATLRLEERVANAPRIAHLADGGMIECADLAAADALLAHAGYRDSPVVRWQGSWRAAVGAMVLVVASGAAAYLWGIPWAGDKLAAAVPAAWSDALGREVLESLKAPVFMPTALSKAQRSAIESDLAKALAAVGKPMPRIEYRSFAHGPNAFALPGDIVVLTDEMVRTAARTKDPGAALLGVLGHECGHLQHLHPLRNYVRATVLGVLIAWWIGDFSSVLATAAPVLLAARYSRDFEREADLEAARLLKAAGKSVEPLIELFELMDGGDKAGKKSKEETRGIDWEDYFSTHPATSERVRRLRESGS